MPFDGIDNHSVWIKMWTLMESQKVLRPVTPANTGFKQV
jgi:hypothetical protein